MRGTSSSLKHLTQKLPLPIVPPQRRPKDRTGGFIRAYAPDLMSCGIDQAMFPDSLETFNLASQSSPWLNAINMAGIAFMHLPTGIPQAASLALMLTVQVAKNMQSRHRYDFLKLDRLSGYLLTFFSCVDTTAFLTKSMMVSTALGVSTVWY